MALNTSPQNDIQAAPVDKPEAESWLERPLFNRINLNWEVILFVLILAAAVVTRFYDLESRVMSHDESLHTYYSWQLYKNGNYQHDPMMHGPLQFHLVALSYFLLGDSDFSARVPVVLFGIASVAFVWAFRRYLGKAGTIAAGLLFVISPYILYYARYVRNESFVVLFGLVSLWAILRYLETRAPRYVFWLVAATALHFTTKETSFIYTAQAMLFLGLVLLNQITRKSWRSNSERNLFLGALIVGLLLLGFAFGMTTLGGDTAQVSSTSVLEPLDPEQSAQAEPHSEAPAALTQVPAALGAGLLLVAGFFLLHGFGLDRLRAEGSFDLLVVLGTMVLPQLSAFPVKLAGWFIPDTPSAVYSMSMTDMLHFVVFMVPLILVSVAVGAWWNARLWFPLAGLFYGIFLVFYTTLFTNGAGFFSGMAGSLGYWLAQQGVQRGSQPWYYYLLVQLPLYEYLPLLASLLGFGYMLRPGSSEPGTESQAGEYQPRGDRLALALLLYWGVSSILAYTVAGEKMPWLSVHIALPLVLLGGWALGQLVERVDWSILRQPQGWAALALAVTLILSSLRSVGMLLGDQPPFQGKQLEQLRASSAFAVALGTALLSAWGLRRVLKDWSLRALLRLAGLGFFALMGITTTHTAFQAAYQNYDQANEYLVYAHSAVGVKDVMAQVEDISLRTTDGLAVSVAYDDDTSWPMTWYLRNYTNARFYGGSPGKNLREVPLIIVGDNNYGKIEPVVGRAYHQFDYIRMVWPNQDYFNLTWQRIWDALKLPAFRAALFQIWLNRDHSQYAEVFNKDISLQNWSPADRMRFYLRKDLAARLWDYATGPVEEEVLVDPYEGKQILLIPDQVIDSSEQLPLNAPRNVALAADGSLFVADTENHRILHLSPDGELLNAWGSFADILAGAAPEGTFNQPWDVAVAPDGSVYVADTWNHRIQQFTPQGGFVRMWGLFGTAESPEAFWGPRDVAVDNNGRVFVTDTGNKRVVIFSQDGVYLSQFGEFGLEPGMFDEPVGLALDSQGRVYIADTWNQRIQVFEERGDGQFLPLLNWEVAAWYGESLDNKPYLAVSQQGHIFASDPEGYRILEFDAQGQFVRYWGEYGTGAEGFGVVNGVTVDSAGGLWVVDSGNNRLLHFSLP